MIAPLDSESPGSTSAISANAIVGPTGKWQSSESPPRVDSDEGPTKLLPLVGWVVLVLLCMVIGALALALVISWIMPLILE
jgi:hypothetical protein